jgi:hypothetical protein
MGLWFGVRLAISGGYWGTQKVAFQTAFHQYHEFETPDGRRWHGYRTACMTILNPEYKGIRAFRDTVSGVEYYAEDAIAHLLQPRAGTTYTLAQAQHKLFEGGNDETRRVRKMA